MKPFPRAAAFISGVALHVAFLFVVGFLAAVHIPRAYFDGFGEHRAIGRALEEAFVMALPTFLLALAWSFLTVRSLKGAGRTTTAWCFAGFAAAWLASLCQTLVHLSANPVPHQYPLSTLLVSFLVPPVWAMLNAVAAPVGILAGGSLARKA